MGLNCKQCGLEKKRPKYRKGQMVRVRAPRRWAHSIAGFENRPWIKGKIIGYGPARGSIGSQRGPGTPAGSGEWDIYFVRVERPSKFLVGDTIAETIEVMERGIRR